MTETEIIERVTALEIEMKNVNDTTHQFRDEIRDEIKEIRKQNESIYEIATSVKIMAGDIRGLREDVQEVKDDQKEMSRKMDAEIDTVKHEQETLRDSISDVDHKDANRVLEFWNSIKSQLGWLIIGAGAAYILYQIFPFLQA